MSNELKDLFLEIEKKHGKGSVVIGNEFSATVPIICSTGSLGLDIAIGCGGIPSERIIQLSGPESSGKTTMSLIFIKEAQKAVPDRFVGFVDAEFSFDRDWASKMGVDVDKLVICQPDTGEEAFDIMIQMIKSKKFSIIVLDSLAAVVTQAQLDGEIGQAHMAQLARLTSSTLPKINVAMNGSGTSVILLNQLRTNIGGYGNPETRPGGNAPKYYSSIIFDTRRRDVIGDKENPIGFITQLKAAKNKCGPPFRIANVELYIGPDKYGIDNFSEIVDIAVENGIVSKGGAWYKHLVNGVEERWQGKPALVQYLKDNPIVFEEIQKLVYTTVIKKDMPVAGSFAQTIQTEQTEEGEKKQRKGRKPKEFQGELEEVKLVDEPVETVVPSEELKFDSEIKTKMEEIALEFPEMHKKQI